MVLRAVGLHKNFGAAAAVAGVDLSVDTGEVVGLLGPNGAGKTTTLRMLAGILPPTSGQVTINGLDVHRDPLAAKPRLGFLSGDTQLYQRLSPREVAILSALMKRSGDVRSKDELEAVLYGWQEGVESNTASTPYIIQRPGRDSNPRHHP